MKTIKEPEAAQWLDERDYALVRSLIEEVRRRQNIANAVVTWHNAFMLFRKMERRIGLPEDAVNRDAYLAVVCELRASGYRLLRAVETGGIDTEKEIGIRVEAVRGCLEELAFDDRAEFLVQDAGLMEEIGRHFAENESRLGKID
jgi:hypothetical protein